MTERVPAGLYEAVHHFRAPNRNISDDAYHSQHLEAEADLIDAILVHQGDRGEFADGLSDSVGRGRFLRAHPVE
jgi:hypothetical protein